LAGSPAVGAEREGSGDIGLAHLLLEQIEQSVAVAHQLLEQMEQFVVIKGWLTCC